MNMKTIECDPKCGFMVRSHEEKEVMSIAKAHAKEKHGMNATDNDLKKMIKNN